MVKILPLSHLFTHFGASPADAFWKHCDKSWNCQTVTLSNRSFVTQLQQTPFKRIVAKGEVAHNEHFLFLPQCFRNYTFILGMATNTKISIRIFDHKIFEYSNIRPICACLPNKDFFNSLFVQCTLIWRFRYIDEFVWKNTLVKCADFN